MKENNDRSEKLMNCANAYQVINHECSSNLVVWMLSVQQQVIVLTTASSAFLHSQSGLTSFSSWLRIRTSSRIIFTNFFRFSWAFKGSGKLPDTATRQNIIQRNADQHWHRKQGNILECRSTDSMQWVTETDI